MDLNNECYKKSIELLLRNSSKYGFLAASPQKKAEKRNYLSVFARDTSICSLGAIASKNKNLILTAKKSLQTLGKSQAKNGQIPNYVKPEENMVDFWRMGCIDATLWWLIAIDFYDKNTNDKNLKKTLANKISIACTWLFAQEHQKSLLLVQNEASDWADIFPRSGKVLYSNSLWLKVKQLYSLGNCQESQVNFNNTFYPFSAKAKTIARNDKCTINEITKTTKETKFLLSYVNYLFWGLDTDVYGNSLALIFNLPTKETKYKIIKYLQSKNRLKNLPIPVLFNPIKAGSREWRRYMESHEQNYPHQYHNGGIWPYASAFYAMALYSSGKKTEAKEELRKIAYANSQNNWEFNEWFHAKTGKPSGMTGQSWNAGAFFLAWHFLNGKIKI